MNLYEQNELCSHQMPNKMQILTQHDEFQFEKDEIWQL